jgi:hypothetical protein
MKSPDSTTWDTLLPPDEHQNLMSSHPYATWIRILHISSQARDGRQPDSDEVLRIIQEWPDKETIMRWKAMAYDLGAFGYHQPPTAEISDFSGEDYTSVPPDPIEDLTEEAPVPSVESPVESPEAEPSPVSEVYTLGFLFNLLSTGQATVKAEETTETAVAEEKEIQPEAAISQDADAIEEETSVIGLPAIPHEYAPELHEDADNANIEQAGLINSENPDGTDAQADFTFFIFARTSDTEHTDHPSNPAPEMKEDTTADENEEHRQEEEKEAPASEEKEVILAPMPGEAFTAWLRRINGDTSEMEESHSKKKKKKKEKESDTEDEEEQRAKAARKLLKKTKKAEKKAKKKRKKSEDPVESIIQESVRFTPAVVTETYAELLVRQGYAEKAKEMYRELMLRNPEKSSYFAAKIKELN